MWSTNNRTRSGHSLGSEDSLAHGESQALQESARGPSKMGAPGNKPWLPEAKDSTDFQIQKMLLVVDYHYVHYLPESSTQFQMS